MLALSPGVLAYKLAHNSYGQYCLTRITHTRDYTTGLHYTRYIFPVLPPKLTPAILLTRPVLFALSNHNDK